MAAGHPSVLLDPNTDLPMAVGDAPQGVPFRYAAAASGIVSSTADVVAASAIPGFRAYVRSMQVSWDALSGATELVLKDGATTIWRYKIPALVAGSESFVFPTALRGTTNTALNIALVSSVTGGVYVSLQGVLATY